MPNSQHPATGAWLLLPLSFTFNSGLVATSAQSTTSTKVPGWSLWPSTIDCLRASRETNTSGFWSFLVVFCTVAPPGIPVRGDELARMVRGGGVKRRAASLLGPNNQEHGMERRPLAGCKECARGRQSRQSPSRLESHQRSSPGGHGYHSSMPAIPAAAASHDS